MKTRAAAAERHTYVYVRFAYRKANGDFDTAPLLLIPLAENPVTITPRPLPVLGQFTSGRKAFATTQNLNCCCRF